MNSSQRQWAALLSEIREREKFQTKPNCSRMIVKTWPWILNDFISSSTKCSNDCNTDEDESRLCVTHFPRLHIHQKDRDILEVRVRGDDGPAGTSPSSDIPKLYQIAFKVS